MSFLIDECRRAEIVLYITVINGIQQIIIFWVTPIAVYLKPGWNLRLRRIVSTTGFIVLGLVQLFIRIQHARSITDAVFGVAQCPPARVESIHSFAWTYALQLCSALLWSPLSWCSRVLSVPTQSHVLKYLKHILLVPVQLVRALFWLTAATVLLIMWLSTSCLAIVFHLLAIPFALFACFIASQLLFMYIVFDDAYFPPRVHNAISEAITLIRTLLTIRHLLQIVGKVAALCGAFSCRDRWFRRDALRTPIAQAIQATYPGLIGPISADESDLTDAIAALRGLNNVWQDLQNKQDFIDDRNTIVYALSYKHIPVIEDGQMIRLDHARAENILRNLMAVVKEHGYRRFMLWCDGASAVGVRTDSAWVDIGLLPYAIYRTARVETRVDGEQITTNRMWLELERGLSLGSCGMDVIEEYINGPKVNYYFEERIRGQGCRAMDAVLRISSKIAQGQCESFEVSRKEDKGDIAQWARRMLLRSGMKEMNEVLGWHGDLDDNRSAKDLLIRITTFTPRRNNKYTEAEVMELPNRKESRAQSNSEEATSDQTPERTEYWLRLLGFTEEEIETLENEDLGLTRARFYAARRGEWKLNIACLQGNYYTNIIEFENVGPDFLGRHEADVGKRWLVTNSQVEKSTEIEEWVKELAAEMFKDPEEKERIWNVEKETETKVRDDTIADWYSDIFKGLSAWRRHYDIVAAEREVEEQHFELESDRLPYHPASLEYGSTVSLS